MLQGAPILRTLSRESFTPAARGSRVWSRLADPGAHSASHNIPCASPYVVRTYRRHLGQWQSCCRSGRYLVIPYTQMKSEPLVPEMTPHPCKRSDPLKATCRRHLGQCQSCCRSGDRWIENAFGRNLVIPYTQVNSATSPSFSLC